MRVQLAGAAVAVALALTGCAATADSSAVDAGAPAQRDDDPDHTSADELEAVGGTEALDMAFVQTVREGTEMYDLSSDEDIIVLGHTVCDAFDAGMSLPGVVMGMGTEPDEFGEAAYLVGAAVTVYCDEHKPELTP